MCKKKQLLFNFKKKIMPIRIFFIVLFMSAGGFTAITTQDFHACILTAEGNLTGTDGSASYPVD